MSPDKDKYLVKAYPKIFRDRYEDMKKTAMCWGFDCNDGWFEIIDKLCDDIQNYLDKNPDVEQVVAQQVKEKFGGLSFYYKGGDVFIFELTKEAMGRSYKTCEFCGSTQNLGRTKEWIYTICKHCYDNTKDFRIKNLTWRSNGESELINNVMKSEN